MLNATGLGDCVAGLASMGMFDVVFIEFAGDGHAVAGMDTPRTREYMKFEGNGIELPIDSLSASGTCISATVAITAADIPEGCTIAAATLVTREGNPLVTVPVDGGSAISGTRAVIDIKVNFGD